MRGSRPRGAITPEGECPPLGLVVLLCLLGSEGLLCLVLGLSVCDFQSSSVHTRKNHVPSKPNIAARASKPRRVGSAKNERAPRAGWMGRATRAVDPVHSSYY